MKRLGILLLLLLPGFLPAEEKNGVRISVEEVEIEKPKSDVAQFWDKLEKTLGLKVSLKNTDQADRPAGRVVYDVIVRRYETEELENFSDSVELVALPVGKEVELELGEIQVTGHKKVANGREYLDAIVAWKVTITHQGVETVSAVSGSDYERLSKALAQRKR